MASSRSPQTRPKRLWKDFFRDPSQWLDCRTSKKHTHDPDFCHRTTKDSLWLDGCYTPSWVPDMLNFVQFEEPNSHAPIQETHNWRLLSLDEALSSLEKSSLQHPSIEDLACILHKCRKEKSIEHAARMHMYINVNGLDVHTLLGNDLVSLLAEVGSVCSAQHVFDKLTCPDQSSWNSLIMGYCKCEEPQHALWLYEKMQEGSSLSPSIHTFVALLKACADVQDLTRARDLHAEIVRKGLLEDAFVVSTLIDTYAKCGTLSKSQEVFGGLSRPDVVSWTALIAGYVEHGCAEEALNYFEKMQQQDIVPDCVTYICILKACCMLEDTRRGQQVAQEMFGNLSCQDVLCWNALVAGYVEHGHGDEALMCYEKMKLEEVSPDEVTFVCLLKACGGTGSIDKGCELHTEVLKAGMEEEPLVGSTLVDMYAKCGSLAESQHAFDRLPIRGVVSWNAMISAYTEVSGEDKAWDCFICMQLEDVPPDAVTFVCCLKACAASTDIDRGFELHGEILKEGLDSDLFVGSMLVDMYAKCGFMAKARDVLDKLYVRDTISWSALITGYVEQDNAEEALNCFEEMQHQRVCPHESIFVCVLKACASIMASGRGHAIHAAIVQIGLESDIVIGSVLVDMYAKWGLLETAQLVFDKLLAQDVVSWNALIAGYTSFECYEKALQCFNLLRGKDICPDEVTYAYILKACCNLGSSDRTRELHAEITKQGLERALFIGSTLVDAYAKCCSSVEAQDSFARLHGQDVVSWTALIAGYALQLGETHKVIHVLGRMIDAGVEPNIVTFVSVLNALSHAGQVDKGHIYFEAIRNAHGVTPTLEHCACMVDLLGRAGHTNEAMCMIKKMPFHPGTIQWDTVLGACRKWGKVELGRLAFENAVTLDEENTAAYVCMSNIYADAAMREIVKSYDVIQAAV